MTTTRTTTSRARSQAARDPELIGLDSITPALVEIIGAPIDRTTTARWLARGVRGHRIAGRRIGKRWAATRTALVEFARESGALNEEGTP